jgi:hypothetical protein
VVQIIKHSLISLLLDCMPFFLRAFHNFVKSFTLLISKLRVHKRKATCSLEIDLHFDQDDVKNISLEVYLV